MGFDNLQHDFYGMLEQADYEYGYVKPTKNLYGYDNQEDNFYGIKGYNSTQQDLQSDKESILSESKKLSIS